MADEEIDKTIEMIMKEMRESPDYQGHSCSANADSQCSHEEPCDPENPKRLKKGIPPYIKHIDFDTKNLNSEEAKKLNISSKCVVINEEKRFSSSFILRKELPKILRAKGLI